MFIKDGFQISAGYASVGLDGGSMTLLEELQARILARSISVVGSETRVQEPSHPPLKVVVDEQLAPNPPRVAKR